MMMTKRPNFLSRNLSADNIALFLQKCLKAKAINPGKQVHAFLLTSGADCNVLSLNSRLVAVYASCGYLKSANWVFQKIQNFNVFALNWMIWASAFNGYYKEAIGYFCLRQNSFLLFYNNFTFSVVLKACVGLVDLNKGKAVHAMSKKLGFENNASVANSLIEMYRKCGCLCYASKVFDRMPERDIESWTTMIVGYCNAGNVEEAFVLFERMKLKGLEPNSFTWNAMITGYARRGDSLGAYMLFSGMIRKGLVPDLATWNAMLSGFVQGQRTNQAFDLFRDMLVSGLKPNLVTVTGLLPACGMIGSIQKGREIHGLIYRMELDFNEFVASALIDMYSKCGSLEDARSVFEMIDDKNVAAWNAMIGCYGKHGKVEASIELFERMQEEGVQANDLTLVSVLSACSHSGYVEKGLEIFRHMKESHRIEHNKEHYCCVVDMLCRCGKMVEAYEFVKEMPGELMSPSVLGAFFNGCKVHGRKDLAKMMEVDAMKWDFKSPGGFATVSNIYAASGEWEEVESVRKMMMEEKVQKKPGFSWIENVVYTLSNK